MSEQRSLATLDSAAALEQAVVNGDLAALTASERVTYYAKVCQSVGLNPLTKPFEYINLDGKLTLYARRDATDQLRDKRKVNVTIVSREHIEDVYVVTARATTVDGRQDESIGAVALTKEDGEWKQAQSGKRYFAGNGKYLPLRGEALANAIMKAETKAKRRVTLSIIGLGWLDETEIETIATASEIHVDQSTGEILDTPQPRLPVEAPPPQFKREPTAGGTATTEADPRKSREFHENWYTDERDRLEVLGTVIEPLNLDWTNKELGNRCRAAHARRMEIEASIPAGELFPVEAASL